MRHDNNELKYIQEYFFNYNAKFVCIYFFYNKISKIHPRLFQEFQNLTKVVLSYNELTEIDENVFERNTKIEEDLSLCE